MAAHASANTEGGQEEVIAVGPSNATPPENTVVVKEVIGAAGPDATVPPVNSASGQEKEIH